jgi:mitochondrial chaperone BCS1
MPKTIVVNGNGDPPQADMLSQFLGNLGLPALVLSSVFPGLLRTIQKHPRIARIITIPFVLWLTSNFLMNKLFSLWRHTMTNAMSSVTITSDDFYLYTAFKSWLSKQRMMMLEKAISAQSVFYLRNKGQDGRTIEKELSNNKSIVFDPQNKFQLFRHGSRFFLLTMDTKQMLHAASDRTEMKIWCLGLSPKPIEDLLLHIYDASRTTESRTLTTIMTPYGGRQWNRRCIKPARPLSSVYLDHAEKDRLVADIKEYLAPTTAKWYQSRGIPYRRGYLFHGSPGCGKSSLALALAGHFKLDVYMVSLLDIEISDSALLQLFQAVRSGVLILLEDVDSVSTPISFASLSRPSETSQLIACRPVLVEK